MSIDTGAEALVKPAPRLSPARALLAAVIVAATSLSLIIHQGPAALAFLAAAIGAFIWLIWLECRRASLTRRHVMAASALLLAVAVITPPRASRDVWSYSMYGEMVARYGASPYRLAPSQFSDDPLYAQVSHYWIKTRSVYGPVFTAVSAAGMALAGQSPLMARLMFQLLAALSVALAMFLLSREHTDARMLAWLGLNPFVIVSVVNGGHNDALCGLALLGAVLLAMKRRHASSGAVFAAGALIKLSILLPGVAVAAWIWKNRGWRASARFSGATAALVTSVYGLAGGLAALKPLRHASGLVSFLSVWNAPSRWRHVSDLQSWLGISRVFAHSVSHHAPMLGTAMILAIGVLLILSGMRAPTPSFAAAGAVLVYMLAASYIEPWYLMWGLPILVVHYRSKLSKATFAYSVLLLVAGIPIHYWGDSFYQLEIHQALLAWLPAVQICGLIGIAFYASRKVLQESSPQA